MTAITRDSYYNSPEYKRKQREAILRENKFARRRRGKGKRPSIAVLRFYELDRLFYVRYDGPHIPDDDDGRGSVLVMLNHLAMLGRAEIRIHDWLARCAPWYDDQDAIAKILKRPTTWKADTLASKLNLTQAERTRLKIKTIGAIDRPKDQRAADRKQKDKLAKQAKRRADGATPRAVYLARSHTRLKPWEVEGKSERSWYRHRGRGSSTVYRSAYTADGPPPSQQARTDADMDEPPLTGREGRTLTATAVVAVDASMSGGMEGNGARTSWDDIRQLRESVLHAQANRDGRRTHG